ncbi:MAG: DUF3570 domain-containing protein [Verrucomicrobia bacterium]|nr:MAG: DUF3570 domain-containing protein [Verrucomicrobiota bacterium]
MRIKKLNAVHIVKALSRPTPWSSRGKALVLTVLLPLLPSRRAQAEERVDFKTLYYKEDGDRMQVLAPSASFETEITPTLSIKMEGVYNAISGATPTGAPPAPTASATAPTGAPIVHIPPTTVSSPAPVVNPPTEDGGDHGIEHADRRLHRVGNVRNVAVVPLKTWAKAGATPAPAPAPTPSPPSSGGGGTSSGGSSAPASGNAPAAATPTPATPAPAAKVPTASSSDHRYGLTLELDKIIGAHTVAAQFAYSTESDYNSKGLTLRDSINFNQKNTTLLLGVSANHDLVQGFWQPDAATKNTYEGIVGVTQLLDPKTFVTLNLTLGRAQGYLTDPYKVVELNGELVPERRPEDRNKQILYLALTRYLESMDASAELSYRYYHDTFNITANTVTFAWYQKLSREFTLRPMLRYYQQSAADFYAVRFSGTPEFYSADYRLSELSAVGYGLKLIWMPSKTLSFDLDVERYEEQGHDGVTSPDAYPGATIVMIGATLWL